MHTHDHAHDSSTSNDLDFSSSASSDPDSFILWPWFFCFRWPWFKLLFFFTSSDFCLFYWRGFTQPICCINLKPFFFFLQWWMMHNLLHLSVQQFLLADTWVNPMTLKSQTRSGDWRKLSKMPGMTWSKCSFCASVFWWTVCASSLLGQCFFAEPLDLWNLTWLHFEQLPLILRFCSSVWLGFFFLLECGYMCVELLDLYTWMWLCVQPFYFHAWKRLYVELLDLLPWMWLFVEPLDLCDWMWLYAESLDPNTRTWLCLELLDLYTGMWLFVEWLDPYTWMWALR